MNPVIPPIPPEKFRFVKPVQAVPTQAAPKKSRGYLTDTLHRFCRNRSSVAAAWILLFLVLIALLGPVLSPYSMDQKDTVYTNVPSYLDILAPYGIFDGAVRRDSQNEYSLNRWRAIALETGRDPVISILETVETTVIYRGQEVTRTSYVLENNCLYEVGIVHRVLSYEEFEKLQAWQNETGIQVIYPYVEADDIQGFGADANIWYEVDSRGNALLDENGDFVPMYATDEAKAGQPYSSLRIAGDDGSYIYSWAVEGAVRCRLDYYNYYIYQNGHAPTYLLGTNAQGQDLLCAIGVGARFSLLFAMAVAAINMVIGILYGALQGYYGGAVDMLLDRLADILSGIPFLVVATLFQLHLSQKVGPVPAFLFAFLLTGWIGVANTVRKQFYRYRDREFVLASRSLGASDRRLMFRHILPNGMGTILTACALVIPGVINMENNLTYLNIIDLAEFGGTSMGTLMAQGQSNMTGAPHGMLWPAVYMALLMIAFNLVSNGLRDAFDPTTKGASHP